MNPKLWLALKGVFIVLMSFYFYYDAQVSETRKILRIILLGVFSISFLFDCYKFSRNK